MGIKFDKVSHYYKGVKKNDSVIAIQDIDLEIAPQDEFIAICGQTGSGKSTLIQHINGLLLPTEGIINIFDHVFTSKKRKNPPLKSVRKRIGFVFQFPEYQLFESTVLKDIMFAPKNFGLKENQAKEEAIKTAKILGIEEILNKSPFNLSGGQMRKVAIAGILAYNPDILVLDEPTRGLDPKGAKEIMELFKFIQEELHKTIILISHDMNIIYQYATRVVAMKNGNIVYDGDKIKLFLNEAYETFSLEKPEVLKTIDLINEKLSLNLDYRNYTIDDLMNSLKKVCLNG